MTGSPFTPMPTGVLRHPTTTDSSIVWAIETGKVKPPPPPPPPPRAATPPPRRRRR
jgi:hypothetical protein